MQRTEATPHLSDTADWRLNVACFFAPALCYFASPDDYFLPLAVFAIAALTGLLSPSHKKKVATLSTLSGWICAFFVLLVWSLQIMD